MLSNVVLITHSNNSWFESLENVIRGHRAPSDCCCLFLLSFREKQAEVSALVTLFCSHESQYFWWKHTPVSQSSLKDFSWDCNCRVEISLVSPVTHLLVPWLRFSVVGWQQTEMEWWRCECHVGQELWCIHPQGREMCVSMWGCVYQNQWQASFSWGAHSGCRSQCVLCHFDLCSCDIFPPCQTKVLSLCWKAQVTWFMIPVWTYSSQTPESCLVVLTELDLKMQRKNSIFVLTLEL